ncbi:MAG: neutral/alkaline non-lysosomal ceramidase N-terminal domain-containing protein [Verrucomicrobia bacterium]|nr:neutral/alkaline non-lysosomal ceramidase N-terminal domain-containing protein [Verrucomicrobiota bacterium]
MRVGTAQVDITPQPGIELAGFAVRPQPSTRILDSLWARVFYLEDGPERLLWLHLDLLALDQGWADRLRDGIAAELGLPLNCVLVSATHTHSAPAAIQLTGCGRVEAAYVSRLERQCREAVRSALDGLEPCRLVTAQGQCSLAVDRRKLASAHTDPRVGAIGWCRDDGTFKAAFLNYAMHPVCLRDSLVSGDWPGEAARCLTEQLPGRPLALVSPGACGNLNPPAVGVTAQQMSAWGRSVAECVVEGLLAARPQDDASVKPRLRIVGTTVDLPLETWDLDEVDSYVSRCLSDVDGYSEFEGKFRAAIETWRATMIGRLHRGNPFHTQVHLGVISFGTVALMTVNAEVFSLFTELVQAGTQRPIYTVSCANGMIGYVPTAAAYDEGGYEVSHAMLFYNLPRPRKGGLELLADRARQLVASSNAQVN